MPVRIDTAVLDRIIASIPTRAAEIVKSGALAVEGYAKTRAPVDTGALRASINSSARSSLSWLVGDGVEYGIYQEFGTSRGVPPHPFMVPAVEHTRPQYEKMWLALVEGR